MDQSQDQIPKAILFNKYLFLKRTLKFVFSVSVLSFFLCCSSCFSVHYPQSFNAYFSTCLLSMFTHTLERKYVFLICNGILAFLAKNSLMASSPPMSSTFDDDIEFQASNMKAPVSNMAVFPLVVEEQALDQVKIQEEHYEEVSEAEEELQEEDDSTLYTQTEGKESEGYISEEEEIEGSDDEEDKEGGTESEAVVITQDDDEVEDTTMATNNEELANTDELNRKFEEFIRKMKEEIRIEAQRQLIAV